MEKEDIIKFIEQTGYATLSSLSNNINGDQEMMDMALSYFKDSNVIGEVKYNSGTKIDKLYFMVPKE